MNSKDAKMLVLDLNLNRKLIIEHCYTRARFKVVQKNWCDVRLCTRTKQGKSKLAANSLTIGARHFDFKDKLTPFRSPECLSMGSA